MKQIYEDLSDDTDFDIIDLADVPDRDTVKRRKKKSQRDVNKTNKSEEVKKKEHSSIEDPSEDSRKERSKKARKRTSGNSGNGSSKASGKKRSTPSASIITTPVKKTVQTGAKITGKLLRRSISADYGDYFLPVGADRTMCLWRQGNKACRYRTGAFLFPVHRYNCSCCRNVLESNSFFSITTDRSCRRSAAVWKSERNPSSIMRNWTCKLYYTENIFLEREICHFQNITGYSATGLVLYPSHSHSGSRTFIHNKNASPDLHRFWHFYYRFSESFFIILQMLLLFRRCCLHQVRTS